MKLYFLIFFLSLSVHAVNFNFKAWSGRLDEETLYQINILAGEVSQELDPVEKQKKYLHFYESVEAFLLSNGIIIQHIAGSYAPYSIPSSELNDLVSKRGPLNPLFESVAIDITQKNLEIFLSEASSLDLMFKRSVFISLIPIANVIQMLNHSNPGNRPEQVQKRKFRAMQMCAMKDAIEDPSIVQDQPDAETCNAIDSKVLKSHRLLLSGLMLNTILLNQNRVDGACEKGRPLDDSRHNALYRLSFNVLQMFKANGLSGEWVSLFARLLILRIIECQ